MDLSASNVDTPLGRKSLRRMYDAIVLQSPTLACGVKLEELYRDHPVSFKHLGSYYVLKFECIPSNASDPCNASALGEEAPLGSVKRCEEAPHLRVQHGNLKAGTAMQRRATHHGRLSALEGQLGSGQVWSPV